MTRSEDKTPLARRDRPGDLGRPASILTWLAIGLGGAGLYLVRQVAHQPLPTLTSWLVIGFVGLLAFGLAIFVLKQHIRRQASKRPGLILTAALFSAMSAFAAYGLAYWHVERHGQVVELIYVLQDKGDSHLQWRPVSGKGPTIRLNRPEPLFMQFGLNSHYPFPLIHGPAGFWLLGSDPDQ